MIRIPADHNGTQQAGDGQPLLNRLARRWRNGHAFPATEFVELSDRARVCARGAAFAPADDQTLHPSWTKNTGKRTPGPTFITARSEMRRTAKTC